MQELQSCHTTVKNFAANVSKLLGAGTSNSVNTLGPALTKMQSEVDGLRKSQQAITTELHELGKRTGGIESILGAVTAKVANTGSNVDAMNKTYDAQLKDIMKGVGAGAASTKQQSTDLSTLITGKHEHLEQGIRECLRKVNVM